MSSNKDNDDLFIASCPEFIPYDEEEDDLYTDDWKGDEILDMENKMDNEYLNIDNDDLLEETVDLDSDDDF